VKMYG